MLLLAGGLIFETNLFGTLLAIINDIDTTTVETQNIRLYKYGPFQKTNYAIGVEISLIIPWTSNYIRAGATIPV